MTNTPKFKVGDHVEVNPSPVHGTDDIETPMPFTTVIEEVETEYGPGTYYADGWYYYEDMLTLVERPEIGSVIKFEDIRVGDTVRRTYTSGDAYYTVDLPVGRVAPGGIETPQGQILGKGMGSTWYLINRPEQDPEVEAIMTALDVDADTASEYRSKGIRVVSD